MGIAAIILVVWFSPCASAGPDLVISNVTPRWTPFVGGSQVTGSVTLAAPAPSGGAEIALTSSSPDVIVPASVVVPAGATSATFSILTRVVAADRSGNFSASSGGSILTGGLWLTRNRPQSVTVKPATLPAGAVATLSIALTGPAMGGGVQVALSTSPAGLFDLPSTVTVPDGQQTIQVPVREICCQLEPTSGFVAADGFGTNLALLPLYTGRLAITPQAVHEGETYALTVTLERPAPPEGYTVALAAIPYQPTAIYDFLTPLDRIDVAIPVPPGQSTATVNLRGLGTNRMVAVNWSAVGRSSGTSVLKPLFPTYRLAPDVADLLLSTRATVGGKPVTGKVSLAAPTRFGACVTLVSDDPAGIFSPKLPCIAPSQASANFSYTPPAVSTGRKTSLRAFTYAGTATLERTAVLLVNP